MKAARERKISTVVDPASVGFLREVGAETFLRWTQGTGTIFANLDEALELTGSSDPNLQMQTLGRFFDRVVLKRGAAGAALGGRKGVTLDTAGASDRGCGFDRSRRCVRRGVYRCRTGRRCAGSLPQSRDHCRHQGGGHSRWAA